MIAGLMKSILNGTENLTIKQNNQKQIKMAQKVNRHLSHT